MFSPPFPLTTMWPPLKSSTPFPPPPSPDDKFWLILTGITLQRYSTEGCGTKIELITTANCRKCKYQKPLTTQSQSESKPTVQSAWNRERRGNDSDMHLAASDYGSEFSKTNQMSEAKYNYPFIGQSPVTCTSTIISTERGSCCRSCLFDFSFNDDVSAPSCCNVSALFSGELHCVDSVSPW